MWTQRTDDAMSANPAKIVRQQVVVHYLVCMGSGRTELELTRAIYGAQITHSRLNIVLSMLRAKKLVRREGSGRKNDPYRYWPVP